MQEINFEDVVDRIVQKDPRYQRDAYLFLREALDHTQKTIPKKAKGAVRHVTGKELLNGIREYGLAQFGPMTMSLFNEWGIHRCDDWGEIVFNLVETEALSKTDTDTRVDFQGGYDFFEAFRKPFLPSKASQAPEPEVKPA